MNHEKERINEVDWKKWGPYLSERQWGTVREDYSADGSAWDSVTHEMARSKAYRWGEDGIAGLCDDQQLLCFSIALWNKKDPIIKERLFGLSGKEGNHGEDVKELYYYMDNTPSHSYMKMLYKYPQGEFPYAVLVNENKKRTKLEPEFEIIDTGCFDDDKFFDIYIEYAKNSPDDILVKISVINRGKENAQLNVIPQLWFRNTWSWGYDDYKPVLTPEEKRVIKAEHKALGEMFLHYDRDAELLFCENETNRRQLYGIEKDTGFFKDGINDSIINGNKDAVNPGLTGTRAALNCEVTINSLQTETILLRLSHVKIEDPFRDFESVFFDRKKEADEFYNDLQKEISSAERKFIQRQALSGMLWNKQFYYYDVNQWLKGDPAQPAPPDQRKNGRNNEWKHLNNADIISMPDKWEFPWYASWDLALNCIALTLVDPQFAKQQLELLVREWYMHPNGQLPACEWDFGDANPPLHAYAAWRVYSIDKKNNTSGGDTAFLESIYHKLIINFTWWVNRKDSEGNNLFEGGFLGLDNISVFDRSSGSSGDYFIEQSDGTSWMAMYSLNMMRISLELSLKNPVYQDMATKFFEHFLNIAAAIENMGENNKGLWDEEDQFFYDVIKLKNRNRIELKLRSLVGLIPMFAVEVLDNELIQMPEFSTRLKWFFDNRPDLSNLVSHWYEENESGRHLLSLLRGHRLKRILMRMLDESEFLSSYGVRSLSKYHEEHPYNLQFENLIFNVKYTPGESNSDLFGGNSNWRGPVWVPLNFLIIESLQRFHYYFGDNFKVEYPTRSGNLFTLKQVSSELCKRVTSLFLKDENGKRPLYGNQNSPEINNYLLFYEYFHGDNGMGLGASHQTGWTGLVALLIDQSET